MDRDALYDQRFFSQTTASAAPSAQVVAPLLLRLVQPQSVLDVGCGEGAWLKAFQDQGVPRLLGLDGSYVDRSQFLLDSACFRAADLARPVELEESFDLALCLEVAEHLPARQSRPLVRLLTRAAPVVLFSAAVPGQLGVGHVNEQWPGYWEARFAEHGYRRLDPIRRHIFQDARVAGWYQQNLFLYASAQALAGSPALRAEADRCAGQEIELVYRHVLGRYQSLRGLLRELPRALWRALRHRAGG